MSKKFVGACLSASVIIYVFFNYFFLSLATRKINNYLLSNFHTEVSVEGFSFKTTNSFELKLNKVVIVNNLTDKFTIFGMTVNIPFKEFFKQSKNKVISIETKIESIKAENIHFNQDSQKTAKETQPAFQNALNHSHFNSVLNSLGLSQINTSFDIEQIDLEIKNKTSTYRWLANNFKVSTENLSKSSIRFHSYLFSKDDLYYLSNTYVPIDLDLETDIKNGQLNLQTKMFSILGLQTTLKASWVMDQPLINIRASTNLPDVKQLKLEKIKIPNFNKLEPSGEVSIIYAMAFNLNNPLLSTINGEAAIDLTTNIDFQKDFYKIIGANKINLLTQFSWIDQKLHLRNTKWNFDLTNLDIAIETKFKKPKSTHFSFSGEGYYADGAFLKKAAINYAQATVDAQGFFDIKNNFDFSININGVNIEELKQSFPTYLNQPIKGSLSLSVEGHGNMDYLNYAILKLKKFNMSHLSFPLNIKREKFNINGWALFDAFATAEFSHKKISTLNLTGTLNGNDIGIIYYDKEIKRKGTQLTSDMSISSRHGVPTINTFRLDSDIAKLSLSGTPPTSNSGKFDISLNIATLNLDKLLKIFPTTTPLVLADTLGKTSGKIRLKGQLDPNSYLNSKWTMDCDLFTNIKLLKLPFDFKLKEQVPQQVKNKEIPTLPDSIVKDSRLLSGLRLKHQVLIQKLQFKDALPWEDIKFTNLINQDKFKLAGFGKRVFNGKMEMLIDLNLLEPDPNLHFNLNSKSLSFSHIVNFILPEYSNLISGTASIDILGKSKLPTSPFFKKNLNVQSSFNLPKSVVILSNILDLVKNKLPIQYNPQPSSQSPYLSTTGTVEVKNETIHIKNILMTNVKKDSITLNGKMDFNLSSSLDGAVNFGTFPKSDNLLSSVLNSKGQVQIPLKITGNLKNPQISFSEDSLQKISERIRNSYANQINGTINRNISSIKNSINDHVDSKKKELNSFLSNTNNELGKKTMNIQDKIKKETNSKIQNLFK